MHASDARQPPARAADARAEFAPRSPVGPIARTLAAICVLALALRVWLAVGAVAVSVDSALFIEYAQRLGREPLEALRSYDQHPGYPALILAVHAAVDPLAPTGNAGWILSGRIAAIVGSVVAVVAVYLLGIRMYDPRRGLLSAAMLALLPDAAQYGADVLSDLPHLALYLLALSALLAAWQRARPVLLLASAGLSAGAFLVRPEGGAVLLLCLPAALTLPRLSVGRRALLALAAAVVFFVVSGPYQLALGELVPKKSPLELLRFGCASSDRLPSAGLPLAAADVPVPVELLNQWLRAARVVYLLLGVLGLIVARPCRSGTWIPAGAFGLHIVALTGLASSFEYLDRRHALVLAVLTLPLAAAGADWIARVAVRRADPRRVAPRRRDVVAVGVVAVCAALTSPWLLRRVNAGEEHVVATAEWLRANTPPGALVVGDRRMHRVAVHADRPFADWSAFMRARPSAWFVVDAAHLDDPSRNPSSFAEPAALGRRLGGVIQPVQTFRAPCHARSPTEFRVYRFEPDDTADDARR